MTKQEFETRVKFEVDATEYEAIEVVYMHSDLSKDDFCKAWRKMNMSRIREFNENKRNEQLKADVRFVLGCVVQNLREGRYSYSDRDRFMANDFLGKSQIRTLKKAGYNVDAMSLGELADVALNAVRK